MKQNETQTQGSNDDKELKAIADFVVEYMEYAKNEFFKTIVTESAKGGEVTRGCPSSTAYRDSLSKWLDKKAQASDSQLVQVFANNSKSTNSFLKIYNSFETTHRVVAEKAWKGREATGVVDSEELNSAIKNNEYVKKKDDLKGALEGSNMAYICKSLANICSYLSPKAVSFFEKQAKFYDEQKQGAKMDAVLKQLDPDTLKSVQAIRARSSSQLVSQDGPKATEMTAIKKSVAAIAK